MTSNRRHPTLLLPLLVLAPAVAAAAAAWTGGTAAVSAMVAGLVAVPAACAVAWRSGWPGRRPPVPATAAPAAMSPSTMDVPAAAGPTAPGDAAAARRAGAEGAAVRVADSARAHQVLLGRLSGALAHDFNNVLGVSSNSLLLLRRLPTVDAHRLPLDALERAIDRGARLVRQLQRLDAPTVASAAPAASDLRATVEDMAELLRTALGSRIALTVDLPADLPPVRAAPGDLSMALLEAALDARDAMPAGGALRLRARVAGDQVEFAVEGDADRSGPDPAPGLAAHAPAPDGPRAWMRLRLPVAPPPEPGAVPG